MSPPNTRHSPAQPLAPVSSTSTPSVHITRPSIDQPDHTPQGSDGTRLSAPSRAVPSSDDDEVEGKAERLKTDNKRREANAKSEILEYLNKFGIPWSDIRRKKSKNKTLSARYKHRLKRLLQLTLMLFVIV